MSRISVTVELSVVLVCSRCGAGLQVTPGDVSAIRVVPCELCRLLAVEDFEQALADTGTRACRL